MDQQAVEAEIAAVNAKINAVEAEMAAFKAKIAAVEGAIAAVEDAMARASEEGPQVEANRGPQERLQLLENSLARLDEKLRGCQGQLVGNQNVLGKYLDLLAELKRGTYVGRAQSTARCQNHRFLIFHTACFHICQMSRPQGFVDASHK